jgi:hypothetical protein
MSLAGFLHVKMGVNIKFITLPQGTLSPNMDSNNPPPPHSTLSPCLESYSKQ